MAGTSFQKRERDRIKQEKAAAKRDRRQNRQAEAEAADEDAPAPISEAETEQILKAVEVLHQRFDAGDISQDDFEEQKAELLGRLTV